MKRKNKTKLIIFLIPMILIFISLYIVKTISYYENDYLNVFGIKGLLHYSDVKKVKQNEILFETTNKDNWISMHFDGYDFQFEYKSEDARPLANIKITSSKYRFGKKKIGVGSQEAEVIEAYKYQYKVKDLDPNEIGFIDGVYSDINSILNDGRIYTFSKPWIIFELDKKRVVKKIWILPWGPF